MSGDPLDSDPLGSSIAVRSIDSTTLVWAGERS
jgi:hypothetical protein